MEVVVFILRLTHGETENQKFTDIDQGLTTDSRVVFVYFQEWVVSQKQEPHIYFHLIGLFFSCFC